MAHGAPYYDRYSPTELAHPLYREHSWWWRFFELSYRGGPAYYSPDIPIGWLSPMRRESAGEGSENVLRFEESRLRSFLWPFNREETGDYDQRVLRALRVNVCAPIVDTYTAHVFSKPVNVEAGAASVLLDVWQDVDLRGMTRDEWMREGVTLAQVFGHAFAVVDLGATRAGPETRIRSLADQVAAGVRPYATWLTPLHVVDWEVDPFGQLQWVRIVDQDPASQRARPGVPATGKRRYRTWYSDHYEIAASDGQTVRCPWCDAQVTEAGPNPLGRVPVEVLYRQRAPGGVDPVGVSALAEIATIDREIFNLLSQRQALLYEQNFPFLAVPSPLGTVNRIDISVHRAFGFDAGQGGGAPLYIQPPTDSIRVIDDQISTLFGLARAISGLSRGTAEQSMAARSGDALAFESHDKSARVRMLAREAEDFERRIWKMVADAVGQDFAARGYVRYPERYDVRSVGDDLAEVEAYLKLGPPPAAKAEVLKQVTHRLLAHLPPDELAAIDAEIAGAVEPPPAVDPEPVPVPALGLAAEEATEAGGA